MVRDYALSEALLKAGRDAGRLSELGGMLRLCQRLPYLQKFLNLSSRVVARSADAFAGRHQVSVLHDTSGPLSESAPAAVMSCKSGMQRADAMVSDGLLASAPETLEDTIAYLGSAYGGAAGYARAVGLNADEVCRIIRIALG